MGSSRGSKDDRASPKSTSTGSSSREGARAAKQPAAKDIARDNDQAAAAKSVRGSSSSNVTADSLSSPSTGKPADTKNATKRVVSPTNSDIFDYHQALQNVSQAAANRRLSATTASKSTQSGLAPTDGSQSDVASSFRSTLALGQLITANTPSAGNRMISQELRSLTSAVRSEGASIRKEIANLPDAFAATLKTVLAEEREQAIERERRPIFGRTSRRFPVYRRPARMLLQFARKSLGAAPTLTSPSSSSTASSTAAPPSRPTTSSTSSNAATQTAMAASARPSPNDPALNNRAAKLPSQTSSQLQQRTQQPQRQQQQPQLQAPEASSTQARKSVAAVPQPPPPPPPPSSQAAIFPGSLLKDILFPPASSSSSYDGEADTDSDESTSTTP